MESSCNGNTLSAWLEDSTGRTVRSSTPAASSSCTTHLHAVSSGATGQWQTIIPSTIPVGTYTLHGRLPTDSQSTGENVPVMNVSIPLS
jgi:hypothetical protein